VRCTHMERYPRIERVRYADDLLRLRKNQTIAGP
jgi:hypothetical protein